MHLFPFFAIDCKVEIWDLKLNFFIYIGNIYKQFFKNAIYLCAVLERNFLSNTEQRIDRSKIELSILIIASSLSLSPVTRSLYLFLIVSIFILSAIGRTLIPRYFRSIFDGGVTELYYTLKNQKESFHNTSITLDCEQCTMVTQYGKPMYTKVRTIPQ